MSNQKLVVEGSDILSSQMMNFWRQVGDGSIKFWNMQAFLKETDPFKRGIITHFKDGPKGQRIVLNDGPVSQDQMIRFWEMVIDKKITSRHLQDLMEGKNPFRLKRHLDRPEFWRESFRLKMFPYLDNLIAAVEQKGWKIDPEAAYILEQIDYKPSDYKGMANLIRPTCEAMGMVGGTSFSPIYLRAEQFRFRLCSPVAGLQLCLHKEMHNHSTIFFGMKPIPGRDGKPRVLKLRRNDNYLLVEAQVVDQNTWWRHSELAWLFVEK